MTKTNVMKILEQKKVPYTFYEYNPETTDGMEVAKSLGEDPNQVFKTLVTTSKSKNNYVFVIPVNKELDLKLTCMEKEVCKVGFPIGALEKYTKIL